MFNMSEKIFIQHVTEHRGPVGKEGVFFFHFIEFISSALVCRFL